MQEILTAISQDGQLHSRRKERESWYFKSSVGVEKNLWDFLGCNFNDLFLKFYKYYKYIYSL